MKSKELKEILVSTPEHVIVIDVREPDEFAEAPLLSDHRGYYNLPLGLVCSLPKEELMARLEEVASKSNKTLDDVTLVVSCRSGGRSSLAQERLRTHGVEAENLEGGYLGW